MRTKVYMALASSIVVVLALVFVEPAGASEAHDGHHYQNHQQATKRARHAASRARHGTRAKRKTRRRAVSYVCPMHPDIRGESRGTCPKCLMDLVVEPRAAKTGRSVKDNTGRVGARAADQSCRSIPGRPGSTFRLAANGWAFYLLRPDGA